MPKGASRYHKDKAKRKASFTKIKKKAASLGRKKPKKKK